MWFNENNKDGLWFKAEGEGGRKINQSKTSAPCPPYCDDTETRPVGHTNASANTLPDIDMNKVAQIRDLQRRFPYNEQNKSKKWWECGDKCGGGVGGCVGKACVGPGGITIKF